MKIKVHDTNIDCFQTTQEWTTGAQKKKATEMQKENFTRQKTKSSEASAF